jgi:hypothetical protein
MGFVAVVALLLVGSSAFAAQGPVTKIRYWPRTNQGARMIGGVFEGSNGNKTNGPYTVLYTITSAPPNSQWTETTAILNNTTVYRYLRYRITGYGDVAEIEFYTDAGATQITGDVFGSGVAYNYADTGYGKAMDGSTSVIASMDGNGITVGLDTGPLSSSISAPSGLSGTVGSSTQINLTWTDNSSDETGFKIMRKAGTGDWGDRASVGAGVTAFDDTGLLPATLYSYRVTATNATGESPYSNVSSGTTSNAPDASAGVTKIRFYPRSGQTVRMAGGYFEGANADKDAGPYTLLYQIPIPPANGAWTEIQAVANAATRYRYLRYRSPAGGYGFVNVAEVEFYRGTTKLSGDLFYAGVISQWDYAPANAFDGNAANFCQRYPLGGGNGYVGFDIGAPAAGISAPTGLVATVVSYNRIDLSWFDNSDNETGFKVERKVGAVGVWGTLARLGSNATTYANADLIPATVYYYRVLATNATEESANSNEANGTTDDPPSGSPGVTKIRYYPRSGFPGRMLNGVFEGSNVDPTNGPYTVLHTIPVAPTDNAWADIRSLTNFATRFRFLRYRGAANEGDVAEIEFYTGADKLSGTLFGTPGSWGTSGNDYTKAFDGSTATAVNWTQTSQFFAGIDIGPRGTVFRFR